MSNQQQQAGVELIDPEDGENRAVRAFLANYSAPSPTVERMRKHMTMSGYPLWPEWVEDGVGHLTKGGAQNWLRHLFGLEQRGKADLQAVIDDYEARLDEANRQPWPEWAEKVLSVIREHSGYDGYDDMNDGIDLPAELDEVLNELAGNAQKWLDHQRGKVEPVAALVDDEIEDIESAFDYVFNMARDPKDGHIAQALADRLQVLTNRLRGSQPAPQAEKAPSVQAVDTVTLQGVRPDGTSENIGTIRTPAKMKAREIIENYIGTPGNPDDDFADDEATQAYRVCLDLIAYLAAPQQPSAPDGWALVPIEPTEEMYRAADKADNAAYCDGADHGAGYSTIWEVMVDAAIASEQEKK
jgi:hypothetical protein